MVAEHRAGQAVGWALGADDGGLVAAVALLAGDDAVDSAGLAVE